MAIRLMDHVGIVVDHLAAAIEFFVELGVVLQGEGPVEGRWVDRRWARGRTGGYCDHANTGRYPATRADEVPLAVEPGRQSTRAGEYARIRHVAFAVQNINTVVAGLGTRGVERVGELERCEDRYRLSYVCGPEGSNIELAEQIS